jgi:Raf kinase inhibitor-like YbhB/YbcL family protein
MAMSLNSPAFQQNGHIPSKYTCEGEHVSPPLAWEGVPNGAKSLVLIIDDPDAPDPKAPKMIWVHWVVYNMPPDTKSLPENAGKAGLPQGTLLGLNDFKKTGYGGPARIKRVTGNRRTRGCGLFHVILRREGNDAVSG